MGTSVTSIVSPWADEDRRYTNRALAARESQVGVVRMLQPRCHMPKPLESHIRSVSRVSPTAVFTEGLGWLKHGALWKDGVWPWVGTSLTA